MNNDISPDEKVEPPYEEITFGKPGEFERLRLHTDKFIQISDKVYYADFSDKRNNTEEYELTSTIMGYDPFPIYQAAQPHTKRIAPIGDNLGADIRILHEIYLLGFPNYEETPGELAKFIGCTSYIGGMFDRCEWIRSGIEALSHEDKMELLNICRENRQK